MKYHIIIEDKIYKVSGKILKKLREKQEYHNNNWQKYTELDLNDFIKENINLDKYVDYVHFDYRL
jgi:hypothetical protein